MAAKGREKIKLESTGKTQAGKPTGTFRTTNKNKSTAGNEKFKIKKFDKRAYNPETGKIGMHVEFKETKLK